MRSFIAVPISNSIRKKLSEWQYALEEYNSGHVKWVEPENLHLTIEFLGSISEEDANIIGESLAVVAQSIVSWDVEVCGIRFFPNEHSPRVIWVGITKGREKVRDLYASVISGLRRCGIVRDVQSFIPHITLGRIKKRFNINRDDFFFNWKSKHAGIMRIDQISLIESTLSEECPIYRVYRECLLIGGQDGADNGN